MLSAKEVPVLEITDQDGSLGLFKVVGEWEGLKKLQSLEDGEVMLLAPKIDGGLVCAFNDLFGDVFGRTPFREMILISASPKLIFRLRKNLNVGAKGGDKHD